MTKKMQFQTSCHIPDPPFVLRYDEYSLSIGSCFAENIGEKMLAVGLRGIVNPLGIMYNPISIADTFSLLQNDQDIMADTLFLSKGRYRHWSVHSHLSGQSREEAKDVIDKAIQEGREYYSRATTVLLTLGSAYAWRKKEDGQVVANCHRMPSNLFQRELLEQSEMFHRLKSVITALQIHSPSCKVIITVSPVRYLRDGLINSNRSKSRLLEVAHQLTEVLERVYYFPAYELVTDELRDYRFYREDMVHPSDQAIRFVWEKFIAVCCDQEFQNFYKEAAQLQQMKRHTIQNPGSIEAKKFISQYRKREEEWRKRFPLLSNK